MDYRHSIGKMLIDLFSDKEKKTYSVIFGFHKVTK